MQTLLLDLTTWDLVADANNNIAVASDPYSQSQDAASACRTFRGEVYYNTQEGVQYDLILGQAPPVSLMKQKFIDAALTVPGVVSANCFLSGINGRQVSGQVQVSDTSGPPTAANF